MTIKKKINISNILMIVVPVFVGFISAYIILRGIGTENEYWETMEKMYNDKNGIFSAQSIAYAYKQELLTIRQKGSSKIEPTKKMKLLEEDMSDLGYHFWVVLDDETYFNNITETETKLLNEKLSETIAQADDITMSSDEMSIVKSTFHKPDYLCTVIAVHTPDNQVIEQSYFKGYLFRYFLLGGSIILGAILFVHLGISIWISKSILVPLNKISEGTRKIKNGELDFQIHYRNKDEFGEVCEDFDEMRMYLKKSVEERLKYEQYRTELLRGISHDLRTPLTSIKGYTEGLMEASNYEVDIEEDGVKGLERANAERYDMILLDVMLPGISGFDICKALRKNSDVPIILVTARKEDIDKIRGLGFGADDYIVKPFSPSELVARVKAHINIHELLLNRGGTENKEIVIKDLRIIPLSRRVFMKDKELNLTNREFDLLLFLAENPNIVFSKETLFDRVWGLDAIGDISTVTVHINRLREKIEADNAKPEYICTIWGAGYRFQV